MTGTEPRCRDFPDHILTLTREIREGRDPRSLDRCSAEEVAMRLPQGIVRGRQAVIDGTMATLAEFPDRQLLAEDVIRCGDRAGGYPSSRRIRPSGTHPGAGTLVRRPDGGSRSGPSPTARRRTI